MLQRHLLRRWRDGLIVQAPAADGEQLGLGAQREGLRLMLHERAPLPVAQAGNFFFKKLTWVVSRPISA